MLTAGSDAAASGAGAGEFVPVLLVSALSLRARRLGQGAEDAVDLTQGFFVHLLVKGLLARADPKCGRLRNFLLTAMQPSSNVTPETLLPRRRALTLPERTVLSLAREDYAQQDKAVSSTP